MERRVGKARFSTSNRIKIIGKGLDIDWDEPEKEVVYMVDSEFIARLKNKADEARKAHAEEFVSYANLMTILDYSHTHIRRLLKRYGIETTTITRVVNSATCNVAGISKADAEEFIDKVLAERYGK